MRVGMMTDTFIPIQGGGEVHVLELSRALRRNGHIVKICAATPGQVQVDGFPVLRMPALNRGGKRAALRAPFALPKLLAWARGVDVLHAHYSYLMAALAVVVGALARKPVLVTLHGLGTLDSSVSRDPIRRVYRWLSLRFADRIIATSPEMRAVALRFAPDRRIVILPNGVDTAKFAPQPAPPRDTVVILSMRRLAPKNGVQYLVEAAPLVLAKVPQARFWLAGAGKMEKYLRQQVTALGIEYAVRFMGVVPHQQTDRMYAQADVVVFPSSAESTSLACLEAMSMEKAIVASALSAYQQMLGKNQRGLLVRLFDREDSDYDAPLTLPEDKIRLLAEAIVQLIENPSLCYKMGVEARAHVLAEYDWNAIARKVAGQYQECLS